MKNDTAMKDCIEACWHSRNQCQKTLFNHCLLKGGEHLAAEHVMLMTDCIQACQMAADAMVRQSMLHAEICGLCAKISAACAESCESLEGPEMQKCAEACRRCADLCWEMSQKAGSYASSASSEKFFGIGP
jgi:hypothetical protein